MRASVLLVSVSMSPLAFFDFPARYGIYSPFYAIAASFALLLFYSFLYSYFIPSILMHFSSSKSKLGHLCLLQFSHVFFQDSKLYLVEEYLPIY